MTENIFTVTSGDTSMTEQYLDTFRRSEHLQPERALVAAVLEDAIHNYRKFSQARDRDGQERFHEAEEWIRHRGNDWIFSFDNVCDLLGLDPEYVRRGIHEASGEQAKKEKSPPRHAARKQAA